MDTADDTRLQLRRLLWWNRFFLALLVLAVLLVGARWKIGEVGATIRQLRVTWQADGSIFLSAADGPSSSRTSPCPPSMRAACARLPCCLARCPS